MTALPHAHPLGSAVPRGLIFDMDGTILDTRAFHMQAWRALVQRHNLPAHYFDLADRGFGKTNWSIFLDWFGPHEAARRDIAALAEEKENLFRECIAGHAAPRPGFVELVERARARAIGIALATSGPPQNAAFILSELQVTQLFDAIVTGSARIRSKPHPQPFLRAAGMLGLAPRACLGFEDSRHGFASVLRAGMRLVTIAEHAAHVPFNKRWYPYAFEDFRPLVTLFRRCGVL